MAVMFMSMGAMPQLALVLASKPVWFKHRDNYFYPAYAHGVVRGAAASCCDITVMALEIIVVSCGRCLHCDCLQRMQWQPVSACTVAYTVI